ncbi:MBL fold metallo-hydrolase [Yinghuangia aomiensis]
MALNVAAVAGRAGFVLVDTGSYERETAALLDGLTAVLERDGLPARALAVVNTHGHFDHCYGNAGGAASFSGRGRVGPHRPPRVFGAVGRGGPGGRGAVRHAGGGHGGGADRRADASGGCGP